MKLDNEEQKKLLLQIIPLIPIHGSFIQAKEAVKMVDKLIEDIQKAEIINEQ